MRRLVDVQESAHVEPHRICVCMGLFVVIRLFYRSLFVHLSLFYRCVFVGARRARTREPGQICRRARISSCGPDMCIHGSFCIYWSLL